jgi:hypothetical protein
MSSPETVFKCNTCQRPFFSKFSLLRHCDRKHSSKYDCEKTETDTSKTGDFSEKTEIITSGENDDDSTTTGESDNKKHKCPLCSNCFTRNWSLTKHMEKCKGVVKKRDKLQCEFCENRFKHQSSMSRHYKTCATKKEMALIEAQQLEEDKQKTINNNSGQMNNQLGSGTQNNTQNNNIIIVYNPNGMTPFSTDHLKAEDFKKILQLASARLDNRALEEYSKQIFENEENRCIKKTNIKLGHSQIHLGDNKWKLQLDKNIYPRLATDLANNMAEYVDEKRETFKQDMYIRLRDFVYGMCDAGYINADPSDREKEIQKEFKTFTEGLKLIVYGNTKPV